MATTEGAQLFHQSSSPKSDTLRAEEAVPDKLHRFFRRRPTMDDVESIGILPDGHSQAMFDHEIHSRLARLGADDADVDGSARRASDDLLDDLEDVNPSSYMKASHEMMERELKALQNTLSAKNTVLAELDDTRRALEETVRSMKAADKKRAARINQMEHELIDEEEKLEKLRARQSMTLRQSIKKETELEMELANQQIVNEQLDRGNAKSRKQVLRAQSKGDVLETAMESMVRRKSELLQRATEQIDHLREYLRRSQEAYAQHRIHHHIATPHRNQQSQSGLAAL